MNRELLQRLFDTALERQKAGELCEAISLYQQLLETFPRSHEIRVNLAVALKDCGDIDGAIDMLRRAIEINPNSASAWSNLGIAWRAVGRLDEAIPAMQKGLSLNDRSPLAWNNLALAHQDSGQLTEAIDCFDRALAIDPTLAAIQSNRLYALHFDTRYDAQQLLDEHTKWAARFADFPAPAPHENDRSADRRLKIGYVSGDLKEHAVGRFILPLLSNHDRSRFEIYCYSANINPPDAFSLRLRELAEHWREIAGLSDDQAAQLIRDDRIDILIDLSLHMAGNRMHLFARKPAPVQATYLAYCSTSGLSAMDYRITDPHLDPPGERENLYTERCIRLPETWWCYQSEADAESFLPAMPHPITFGCLNNFCKVPPALFTWCEILRAIPQSRLVLHAHAGGHQQEARDLLARENVDPARLSFVGFKALPEYLALYNEIDIALDTFPYSGGTTTCDALWMGVPVITMRGQRAIGRGGVSILLNLGLRELIAGNKSEYVKIAAALAEDALRLSDLRLSLREKMRGSPLMDAPRFSRNMESLYIRMWKEWLKSPRARER